MRTDLNKYNNILIGSAVLAIVIFNFIICLGYKDYMLSIIVIIFSLIIVFILYFQKLLLKKYVSKILEKLSDMLSTISDMQEKEVFSIIEDSMFSKLQFQTIKVIKVLKSQNIKIEKDKNEIKSLISDISHQLKTPLTNMKIYSELLKDENLSEEEKKEFYEVISTSLNKLIFLVESMIKMSRLESGIINITPKKTDVSEVILLAIKGVYKKAQNRNINIVFYKYKSIYVVCDKKWTVEAIFNILENAVKYSYEGENINITLESYDMFVRIDIKNKGIGISKEEIPKIFKRFYRGKNVREVEGVGLGLYLASEIISKQNGYIKVSNKNEEIVFSVFIPI